MYVFLCSDNDIKKLVIFIANSYVLTVESCNHTSYAMWAPCFHERPIFPSLTASCHVASHQNTSVEVSPCIKKSSISRSAQCCRDSVTRHVVHIQLLDVVHEQIYTGCSPSRAIPLLWVPLYFFITSQFCMLESKWPTKQGSKQLSVLNLNKSIQIQIMPIR